MSSSEDDDNHDDEEQEEELKQARHLDYDSIEEDNNNEHKEGTDQNDSDHDATYEAYNDTVA